MITDMTAAFRRARGPVPLRLALAASISALALSAPGLAQTLPAGCTSDSATPGTAAAGDTVTCVGPAITGPISLSAEDLTLIVGDEAQPVSVTGGATGISLTGAATGDQGQTVTINNAASVISGTTTGIEIATTGGAGGLTVTAAGRIEGGSTASS